MRSYGVHYATFFQGVRPVALVFYVLGGCIFLAAFFIQDVHGLGRALGLLGIGIALCGVILNLSLEALATNVDSHQKHHLAAQALLTSVIAVAVFALALYLYRNGKLPAFMPARYAQPQHGVLIRVPSLPLQAP